MKKILFLFIVAIVSLVTAQAQKAVVDVMRTYDTEAKIKTEKGSNAKMETKNGKLYIRHKGKAERVVSYFYSGLDAFKECFDLNMKLELKFVDGDEKSSFGLEFYTFDAKQITNYLNTVKFMLTGDGRLQFYSGSDETVIINKMAGEPCASFKPKELNALEVIRTQMDWWLLINGDTVKHVTETALHPVVKLYTGNLVIDGTCEVELDNMGYIVKLDEEVEEKKTEKLKSLEGSYFTYSSCLKTANKRTTLQLKHEGGNKFTLTGLGKYPATLYLDEKEANVFSNYDMVGIEMGGESYNMRRLKITGSAGSHNITFNVFAQDSKTITDCDFDGDQK